MKKYLLIIGAIVMLLLLVLVYFKVSNKKTQKVNEFKNNAENGNSKTKNNDLNAFAINYALSDKIHTLKIKKSADIYIKNTSFSTPDNVNIAFSNTDFDLSDLPVSNMMVVPKDYVKKRIAKLKLTAKYKDDIQEFMAFNSSTQCSILKPEDFKKEKIADYSVWVAHRTDKCTFRVEKPFIQVINMYGFEANGYVVVLSANGHKEEVPQNVDELIRKVISLTTIE